MDDKQHTDFFSGPPESSGDSEFVGFVPGAPGLEAIWSEFIASTRRPEESKVQRTEEVKEAQDLPGISELCPRVLSSARCAYPRVLHLLQELKEHHCDVEGLLPGQRLYEAGHAFFSACLWALHDSGEEMCEGWWDAFCHFSAVPGSSPGSESSESDSEGVIFPM